MKQDVVIFSMFSWSSKLMHREHMIAKSFKEMGYKVTFIERKYFGVGKSLGLRSTSRTEQGIEIVTLPSFPYMKGKLNLVYKLNDKVLGKSLKKVFESLDENAWLLLSTPNWGRAVLANKKKTQVLAYDMSDDLSAFATNEKWKKRLETREKELLKEADIVFVTAKNLLEKTKTCRNAYLVENGVDVDAFKDAKPALKDQFQNPIAGYIGGIYKWIDLDLIQKAASLNPNIDFVLVGPTDRRPEVEELTKLKNIHYLGEVKWQDIGGYFASLDIGLIPFVSEEEYPRLKTANSNKVFQYAYFGYPIVSTDFTQVHGLGNIITVCKNENDFISSLELVLGDTDNKSRNSRIEYAKSHSWKNQVQKIIDELMRVSH